ETRVQQDVREHRKPTETYPPPASDSCLVTVRKLARNYHCRDMVVNVAADSPDNADHLGHRRHPGHPRLLLCLFVARSPVSSLPSEKAAIAFHSFEPAARGGSAFSAPRRCWTLRGKCNRLDGNCGRGATRRSAFHHRARRSR